MQQSEGRAALEAVPDHCLIQPCLQLAAESYPGTAGTPGWDHYAQRLQLGDPTEAQSISHGQPRSSMARSSSSSFAAMPTSAPHSRQHQEGASPCEELVYQPKIHRLFWIYVRVRPSLSSSPFALLLSFCWDSQYSASFTCTG